MDSAPGLVLLIGAIASLELIGWDTFQAINVITKADRPQSLITCTSKQQVQRTGLFNRG